MQQQIQALGIPMLLLKSQHLDDLPVELRLLGIKPGTTNRQISSRPRSKLNLRPIVNKASNALKSKCFTNFGIHH